MPNKIIKQTDKNVAEKLIVEGSTLADKLVRTKIGTPEFKSTVNKLITNLKVLKLHVDEKM